MLLVLPSSIASRPNSCPLKQQVSLLTFAPFPNFICLITFTTGTGLWGAASHFLSGNLTLSNCGFRVLTLPRIITIMSSDETKWKSFYTLFLDLTWFDTPFRKEENPFAEVYQACVKKLLRTGTPIEYDLAHLKGSDVKDPRIATDRCALLTLNLVHFYLQVIG